MGEVRWNHNIHYHRLLIEGVPRGGRILDVGCGEGMLTRELAARASAVVGLDVDAASIDLARATTSAANVEYVCADLMHHPFELGSFDAVVSVAVLHHLGTEAGLLRMRDLVRPGGMLGAIGLASNEWPRDIPWAVAGAVGSRWLQLSRRYWEHSAPKVWDSPDSFRAVRHLAQRCLPGAHFRRLLLWRFAIMWRKPISE